MAIFVAAVTIVRLYRLLTPRMIGSIGFVVVSAGLAVLAFSIGNDWGTPMVILGLVILGLGEGALLTLLFNVLVSASPKELAGDVGALRGTANNCPPLWHSRRRRDVSGPAQLLHQHGRGQ